MEIELLKPGEEKAGDVKERRCGDEIQRNLYYRMYRQADGCRFSSLEAFSCRWWLSLFYTSAHLQIC
jgi:hypothetical protein